MFSEPAIGERFFGREEVLELLNKRASALKDGYRQNVALTGQSLAGKSSIILHFLHTIREEGFIPVYVEVVKEPFRLFANKFIATMLFNALTKKGEAVNVDLEKLLERSQKVLPKTYAAIKRINSLIERSDHEDAYVDLLALTSTLKDETGAPCIVILDEFDNLECLGIKNPFLGFGKVIMVQKDTMYIVSSSRNEAIKKIISEKLSLLFGNFEVIKVSNFDQTTSARFIDIKLGGFEVETSIKKFLITFTDGNPFYLEKLSSRARTLATERLTSYVDIDIISDCILDTVYDAGGAIHQYLLTFVLELLDTKYRDSYLSILTAIAGRQNKKSDLARSLRTKQGEISKGLARLSELGLISRNGVFFKIDDVMLEFWLKYVYQRRKGMLVSGIFDKKALFKEELKEYICQVTKDFNKKTPVRLAELFNLFSNELVQIQLKNLRLPHFSKIELRTFNGTNPLIVCSYKGNVWIVRPFDENISENDIVAYIRDLKMLNHKVANKIIVHLKDIDENAKLLAKELRISIWDRKSVNMLIGLYGKKGIFTL